MTEAGTIKQIKRKDLPLSDKILVIDELDKKTLQSEIAKKFGISQSQVSRIAKTKEKLLYAHRSNVNPSQKRTRKSTHEDVEDLLLQWFKQAISRGVAISGPMLREKAKEFGKIMDVDFDPSRSWITRWRRRHLVVFKSKHGTDGKKSLILGAMPTVNLPPKFLSPIVKNKPESKWQKRKQLLSSKKEFEAICKLENKKYKKNHESIGNCSPHKAQKNQNTVASGDGLSLVGADGIQFSDADSSSDSNVETDGELCDSDSRSDFSVNDIVSDVSGSSCSAVHTSQPNIVQVGETNGAEGTETSLITASVQELLKLFEICHAESSCTANTHIDVSTDDKNVSVISTCENHHTFIWQSEVKKVDRTEEKQHDLLTMKTDGARKTSASRKKIKGKKKTKSSNRPYYTLQFANDASSLPD